MRMFEIAETADFLETSIIENTIDHGHAITRTGPNAAGLCFVLINNHTGTSVLSESI